MPTKPKVSVCIANYKQDKFIPKLVNSICEQDYDEIETVIYDDKDGIGSGEAFNKAIDKATGEIIVLLCADDVFVDPNVISDIVKEFEDESVGHVSRYYFQFLDGTNYPVRAWRGDNIIELANNPSGLAFRREALFNSDFIDGRLWFSNSFKLSNKMFVEAPTLVASVIRKWKYKVLPYDTVGVRIHNSTARSTDYYTERWVSSPVEEWVKLGGDSILNDFTSLVQIKNYFTMFAVWKEIKNFVRLRPLNLINPGFLFYAVVSLAIPRFILRHLPHLYRITFGRWTTRVRYR